MPKFVISCDTAQGRRWVRVIEATNSIIAHDSAVSLFNAAAAEAGVHDDTVVSVDTLELGTTITTYAEALATDAASIVCSACGAHIALGYDRSFLDESEHYGLPTWLSGSALLICPECSAETAMDCVVDASSADFIAAELDSLRSLIGVVRDALDCPLAEVVERVNTLIAERDAARLAITDLLSCVDMLFPGVSYIAVRNLHKINTAPVEAKELLKKMELTDTRGEPKTPNGGYDA